MQIAKYIVIVAIAVAAIAQADYSDLSPGAGGVHISHFDPLDQDRPWIAIDWHHNTLWAPVPGDAQADDPAWQRRQINGGVNDWIASAVAGEFYYAGSQAALITAAPPAVYAQTAAYARQLTAGDLGSLAAGEWAWGDNDAIGDDRIYARLDGDADPDTAALIECGGDLLGSVPQVDFWAACWMFEEASGSFVDGTNAVALVPAGTIDYQEQGIWDYAAALTAGATLTAADNAAWDIVGLTLAMWVYVPDTWRTSLTGDHTVIGRGGDADPWRLQLVQDEETAGNASLVLQIGRDGVYETGASIRIAEVRRDGWSLLIWTFDPNTGYCRAMSCGRVLDHVALTAAPLETSDGALMITAPEDVGLTQLGISPYPINAYMAADWWHRTSSGVRCQVSIDAGLTWTDDQSIEGGYIYAPTALNLTSPSDTFGVRFEFWTHDYAYSANVAGFGATYLVNVPDGTFAQPVEPFVVGEGFPVEWNDVVATSGVGQVRYRMSPNGANWYYHDGTVWAGPVVGNYAEATTNTAAEISAGLADWRTQFPDATLISWQAFLVTGNQVMVYLDQLSLIYAPGSVSVTAPAQDDIVSWGRETSVAWTPAGTVSGRWDLAYSIDGGASWTDIVLDVSGNAYAWDVPPAAESNTARVRVRDHLTSVIQDASSLFQVAPPEIRISEPAAGTELLAGAPQAIAWIVRPGLDPSASCIVEYSYDQDLWTTIATLDGSAGTIAGSWTVPTVQTASVYIRFRDPENAEYTDTVECSIRLGYTVQLRDRIYAGTVTPIAWTASTGSGAIVDIHYSTNGGMAWTAIARRASIEGAANTYLWQTPRQPAAIIVRVRSITDTSMAGTDSSILAMLRLTAPSRAQTVADGQDLAITWASAGAGDTVRIGYATSDSLGLEPTEWITIAAAAPNTGSYSWTVDAWPTARARIRVQSVNDIHIQDISPEFTVTAE